MVNTVGSFVEVNKRWQKKWIPIKQSLLLNNEQRSVLIGSILGDGTLRTGERAINANFKVEHGLAQKDYVFWKYKIFRPWVFTEPKISYRYQKSGEKYAKSWWFRTIRHPILTKFYNRFYESGKKTIPDNIATDLNGLAMAVWIMDDGCLSKNSIDLSTYSFTLPEIEKLRDTIRLKFGLVARYHSDRNKGFRMYFNNSETKKLIDIIQPHVIPVMNYKIKLQQ